MVWGVGELLSVTFLPTEILPQQGTAKASPLKLL